MPKPTFDSLTLAAVVHELQAFVGGRVQGVRQPGEHLVVLEIHRAGAGSARWLIDCSANWARTHLTSHRASNPQAPPAFCMALRKYLDGGVILSIEQRGFDRILDVAVRGHEGADYLLTAELMGRHSNLILLGPLEAGQRKIIHAAKMIPAKLSRVREILSGKIYTPPPVPQGGQVGLSPFLKQEIAARGDDSFLLAARAGNWQPVLLRDDNGEPAGAYPIELESWPSARQEKRDSLHAALDEWFAFAMPRAQMDGERRTLAGALEKAWQQRAQSLAQVEHGQAEGSRAAYYRRCGDLILGNLWQIEAGQGSAVVPDYFEDPPVEVSIALDDELSPQENAQRYFERARQGEKGAARLAELRAKMSAEVAAIEALQGQVVSAGSLEELAQLREEIARRGWLQSLQTASAAEKSARPDFGGHRIRTFTSPDGHTVFVGESATANDYLVTRLGHGNDWWLHLRAGTSAHAIIKTNNAPDQVPRETLEFAARLVVQRSAAKHAGMVAVDCTLRKYVRKPRKAAPGSVTYSHEKTLHVSP